MSRKKLSCYPVVKWFAKVCVILDNFCSFLFFFGSWCRSVIPCCNPEFVRAETNSLNISHTKKCLFLSILTEFNQLSAHRIMPVFFNE